MKSKLTILVTALLAGVTTPACVVDDEDGHHEDTYVNDGTGLSQAVYTTIDADHVLDTDLGLGAGMFVEYGIGGRWTLWTSCDTELTGSFCEWEAYVTTQKGSITDVLEFDTEGIDSVDTFGGADLNFFAETGLSSDAVEFYTEPGALLEVRLVLDGYESPQYLVWFGNDVVNDGSDGSPVVFQPDQP